MSQIQILLEVEQKEERMCVHMLQNINHSAAVEIQQKKKKMTTDGATFSGFIVFTWLLRANIFLFNLLFVIAEY